MKALARPEVAHGSGGRATSGYRKIENDREEGYELAQQALGYMIVFCAGAAFGLLLALLLA